MSETTTIKIDGASRGNPGDSGIGIIFTSQDGISREYKEYIGKGTNNNAEYTALIKALEIALSENISSINVFTDSQLVANQINGLWKVKDRDIRILHSKSIDLIKNFEFFTIAHIDREKNSDADRLANEAINEYFK